jgi:alcohol dehydrogenase (NADP+)
MKRPDEPQPLADPMVHDIANQHGATPAQVLIGWAIQRGTSVIPKSVNPERIRQNFEATKIELNPEDMLAITALDRAERIVVGEFFCPPGSPYTVEWLWS